MMEPNTRIQMVIQRLMQPRKQIPMEKDTDEFPNEASTTIKTKRRHQRWLRIAMFVVFVLVGQSAATLLGRLYYQEGGHSKWLGTLVTLVGFPILLPLYSIPASKHPSATNTIHNNHEQLCFKASICFCLPWPSCCIKLLLILCWTHYIVNSLVLLTVSSILLVFQTDSSSSESTQVSKHKYMIGFICTVAASAGYGLVLSLTQLALNKVFKRVSFKVILDLIVFQSLVATLAILMGLFASGEFRGLKEEMKEYGMGKASYVLNLSFTAITWQVFKVGCVGLILEVSSLFSNVTSVLGLPIVPILALVFFHDKINGLKVISLLLALWSFLSYTYQQYLDETNSKDSQKKQGCFIQTPNGKSQQVEGIRSL